MLHLNRICYGLFYLPPSHEHRRQPSLASFTSGQPSSQIGAALEHTFCVLKETLKRENCQRHN